MYNISSEILLFFVLALNRNVKHDATSTYDYKSYLQNSSIINKYYTLSNPRNPLAA